MRDEFEEVHRKPRETGTNLFRKWENVYWCCKVSQVSDERLHNYLWVNQIKWQFNLSRAPWWGGQFERIIGIMKSGLHKSIGNGMLSWKELQEI